MACFKHPPRDMLGRLVCWHHSAQGTELLALSGRPEKATFQQVTESRLRHKISSRTTCAIYMPSWCCLKIPKGDPEQKANKSAILTGGAKIVLETNLTGPKT